MSSVPTQQQQGTAEGQQPQQSIQQTRSQTGTPAPAAANSSSSAQQPQATANIIAALSSAFKSSTGESLQNDKIASLLLANMEQITALEKQGRLTHAQIQQVRASFAQI